MSVNTTVATNLLDPRERRPIPLLQAKLAQVHRTRPGSGFSEPWPLKDTLEPSGRPAREVELTAQLVGALFAQVDYLGDLNDSKELPARHSPQYPWMGPARTLAARKAGCSGCEGSASTPATRFFGGLLIDCEEDRTLRAVFVGMLREGERQARRLWTSQDVPCGGKLRSGVVKFRRQRRGSP
jgi:hypothetical protein